MYLDPDRQPDAVDIAFSAYLQAAEIGPRPDVGAFLAAHSLSPPDAAELRGLIEVLNDFLDIRDAGPGGRERFETLKRRMLDDAQTDRLRHVLPELCPGCGSEEHEELAFDDAELKPGCQPTREDLMRAAELAADG